MALCTTVKTNSLGGYGCKFISPFVEEQIMSNEWLDNDYDKLRSLLADEAKMMPILDGLMATIKQLKAKQAFRIALINQLIESHEDNQ
jgi:hypothetical protein